MQNQRTKFVVLIVVMAVVTMGWIVIGTGPAEVPYVSIEELHGGEGQWVQTRFRLGGLVEEGSISYSDDRLNVDFIITQDQDQLPVRYRGLTPDMFSEGAEVIIEGQLEGEVFIADNLMTKCASRYEVEIIDPLADPHDDI
ncbi:MAG: cytochrome c maturation protein CcmE [Chloroflexi bacterium]|nr:cytochrome c maturation protein CcmE [Chloroflexota bacterium]